MNASRRSSPTSGPREVHQLLPRLAWGDAVGNQVRYLQGLLRSWGFASEIYAEDWDDACKDQVRHVREYAKHARPDSVLLVHHSFQSRLVPLIVRAPGRKVLVYHNVTPARLFEGFERKVAAACDAARDELLELRPHIERAFAYSRFSAEELMAAGYASVSTLPFAIDWSAFDAEPDPALLAELSDGFANVLFVGRAVPSKKVDDVLRVFTAYQRLYQPRSRLVVAGYLHRDGAYGAYLHGLKEVLGAERVLFLGRVSAEQLSACFATASAYLSMSRHEGFGVPLLEAMYRNVPVVAYGAAAVPETLGGAGLATLSDDPAEVAELLAVLDRSPGLRAQVLEAQRARLQVLSQARVAEQVREAFDAMLTSSVTEAPSSVAVHASATVELVCPGYTVRPDDAASRVARHLAERLPGARVLALRPRGAEASLEVAPEQVEGVSVRFFTPDQPVGRGPGALPGSSSLETAVRVSSEAVILLGVDSLSAQALMPHVGARALGTYTAEHPSTVVELARRHLGDRLVMMEPSRLEETVMTLLEGFNSVRGDARAR
ncbi:glycosyltransferase [Myxococcus llanfairpwllgwyngyllgogerychwyrndrobwllllantysiliogogogochensis]|uniref:glycosyltransferase n=1 Tax=Myxococcus TaxID=32 RepID=UPI001FE90E67|nr:glycosyltransferase [Myxococcus llanfairpwllgwyngyllgogerychwyrndrobwllllantysiliogogogochensis]